MDMQVDISSCPSPYSWQNKLARVLWGFVWLTLFRCSPKPAHAWRRFLLRLFGARIGRQAYPHASCRISEPWKLVMDDHSCMGPHVICYCGGGVRIGAHSTVSQHAHLCAASHDYEQPHMPQTFAPVTIEDQVWVCADAFVGPGVTVRQGAVVGARACVFRDVEPWTVVGGNPAQFIKKRRMRAPMQGRREGASDHRVCSCPEKSYS